MDIYQEIIESNKFPMLVNALAGSGKTTILTKKIKYRIDNGLVNPINIMVCTFTREAANELRHRTGATFSTIGTIHSIMLGLLKEIYPKVKVIDDNAKTAILFDIIKKKKFKFKIFPEVMSISSFHKNVTLDYYSVLNKAYFRNRDNQILSCLYEYEQHKERNNEYDFGDMCLKVYLYLKENPDFAFMLSKRFDEIYIDETQDCSPVQIATIMEIARHHNRLFAVGDVKQKIYSFITG